MSYCGKVGNLKATVSCNPGFMCLVHMYEETATIMVFMIERADTVGFVAEYLAR